MTAPRRSSSSTWFAFAAFYCALTVVYAWPLVKSISSVVPHDAGDPALTTWMVWWNSQAVPLTERWWNAPIFYPVKGAFAFSETMLALSLLTTPMQWLGASAFTAHNVAFLLTFPLSAFAAHALAYRLTGRHDAALIAGLAFGFSPNRVSQLPHIQVLSSMWIPAGLLMAHRYLDTHKRRYLVLLGVAWVLNALSSGYFLVFFATLLGLWMLWFTRSPRDWLAIALTIALASVVIAPVFWGHHKYQSAMGFSRTNDEIETFSADLSAYWAVSSAAWLPNHWSVEPRAEGEFYPGIAILVLALAGGVVAWRRAQPKRRSRLQLALVVAGLVLGAAAIATYRVGGWRIYVLGLQISLTRPGKAVFAALMLLTAAVAIDRRTRAAWARRSPHLFYVIATVAMVLFSLGPAGRLFGVKFLYQAPYWWLMRVPGASGMRAPARFGVLALLCLAVAGAIGFARLTPRGVAKWVVGVLGVLILADAWTLPFPVAPWAPIVGVKAGGDTSVPVVELPMTDAYSDLAAMLRSMVHKHPVVNGFSGYGPVHYLPLQAALNAGDPSAFDALRTFGPIIAAIDHSRDPEREQEEYVRNTPGATLLYRSPLGPVFQFPAAPRPPIAHDPELPIAYVDSNQDFIALPRLLDHNLQTWWQSQEPQSGGDEVIVGFDRPVLLSRVELDLSATTLDYPRKLRVETAEAGKPSVLLWEGRGAALAILGALEDYNRVPLNVDIPHPIAATRFRLMTMERERTYHWSIAEIRAYGTVE